MRSQEDILIRYNHRKGNDPFGFEVDEYILALDFEHAIPFLKDGTTPAEWHITTQDSLVQKMKGYMPFAIGKAEDACGVSANRSIQHYIAWLWLAEENELLEMVESEYENNYHSYGLPILRMIQDHFGWQE